MATRRAVPIRVANGCGVAYWDAGTWAFGARIDRLDVGERPGDGDDPWSAVQDIGGELGRYVTVDRLINELGLIGQPPDSASRLALTTLGERVSRTGCEVQIVGFDGRADGRLFLAMADRPLVPLVAGPVAGAPRLGWGRFGRATIEAARLIVSVVWSRRWGPDEELFADGLAASILADLGPSFSVAASSLCAWFLLDTEPVIRPAGSVPGWRS